MNELMACQVSNVCSEHCLNDFKYTGRIPFRRGEFGKILKILRADYYGFTREEFAEALGVIPHTVYEWEEKGVKPNYDSLIKIYYSFKCGCGYKFYSFPYEDQKS